MGFCVKNFSRMVWGNGVAWWKKSESFCCIRTREKICVQWYGLTLLEWVLNEFSLEILFVWVLRKMAAVLHQVYYVDSNGEWKRGSFRSFWQSKCIGFYLILTGRRKFVSLFSRLLYFQGLTCLWALNIEIRLQIIVDIRNTHPLAFHSVLSEYIWKFYWLFQCLVISKCSFITELFTTNYFMSEWKLLLGVIRTIVWTH